MYCRTNKGFILKEASWESKLLNKPDARYQIEDILKKGCRLYVRRYLINKASNWEKTLGYRDHYDYGGDARVTEKNSVSCLINYTVKLV